MGSVINAVVLPVILCLLVLHATRRIRTASKSINSDNVPNVARHIISNQAGVILILLFVDQISIILIISALWQIQTVEYLPKMAVICVIWDIT
jgi:hypothetical protein